MWLTISLKGQCDGTMTSNFKHTTFRSDNIYLRFNIYFIMEKVGRYVLGRPYHYPW